MAKVTQIEFFRALMHVAVAISSRTGGKMRVFPLLVQMADETGWNTSGCNEGDPNLLGANNFAGISPGGHIANFADTDQFVSAYVATISQNGYGFPAVLAARDDEDQMTRLGMSGWAGSHYDRTKTGRPGIDLIQIYRENKTSLDTAYAEYLHANTRPFAAGDRLLYKGTKGPDVKELQALLGMPAAQQDDIFGPITEEAVKEYQAKHGLTVDGIVGPQTWGSLLKKSDPHAAAADVMSAPAGGGAQDGSDTTTNTGADTANAPVADGNKADNGTMDASTGSSGRNLDGQAGAEGGGATGTEPSGVPAGDSGNDSVPSADPASSATPDAEKTPEPALVTLTADQWHNLSDTLFQAAQYLDNGRQLLDRIQAVVVDAGANKQ